MRLLPASTALTVPVTWYPGGSLSATRMCSPMNWAAMMATIRSRRKSAREEYRTHGGPAHKQQLIQERLLESAVSCFPHQEMTRPPQRQTTTIQSSGSEYERRPSTQFKSQSRSSTRVRIAGGRCRERAMAGGRRSIVEGKISEILKNARFMPSSDGCRGKHRGLVHWGRWSRSKE